MATTVPMIGIHPTELHWIRTLIHLLRHPDPAVPALARQALTYLEAAAAEGAANPAEPLDHAG